MLSIVLVLIIIFIAAGIVGFVVQGLFWLFVVAAILFVITLVYSLFGAGQRRERRRSQHILPRDDEE